VHDAGIGAAVDHHHAKPFGHRDQTPLEQRPEPVKVASIHKRGAANEHDD
jgi:hypothetical protein